MRFRDMRFRDMRFIDMSFRDMRNQWNQTLRHPKTHSPYRDAPETAPPIARALLAKQTLDNCV
jgi:hypothetical protein